MHIRIAQSEMMPDFMNHDMADQLFQLNPGLRHLREQRAAVEENPVPLPARRREQRFFTNRNALIQPGQLIRAGHAEMIENILRRPILNAQHDIGKMFGERRRDGLEYAAGDGFEVGYCGLVGHY